MPVGHHLALCSLSAAFAVALACAPAGPATTDDSATSTGGTTTSGSTTGATTTVTPTTGGTSAGTSSGTSSGTTDTLTSNGSTTAALTSDGDTTTTSTTGDTSTSTTGVGSTTSDTDTESSTTGGGGLGDAALAAMEALEQVVAGVTWPSESDYPWTVFGIPNAAPVTVDNLKALVGDLIVIENGEPPLADQVIEEEPWQNRFDQLTTPEDWWTDYEYTRAEQYAAIRDALILHLVNIKLFRIGEDGGGVLSGAIDMFVIGETADGDLVGIQTISIET